MNQIASVSNKPILAGIFLLKSAKNAEFIRKNVPGVHIPDEIIQRLANAKHPLQEGINIAAEQVKLAQQICQGVHIMAIKKEELVPEILNRAGIEAIAPL
jgi:methylenetetrahydrofolate reductase (NADPH)